MRGERGEHRSFRDKLVPPPTWDMAGRRGDVYDLLSSRWALQPITGLTSTRHAAAIQVGDLGREEAGVTPDAPGALHDARPSAWSRSGCFAPFRWGNGDHGTRLTGLVGKRDHTVRREPQRRGRRSARCEKSSTRKVTSPRVAKKASSALRDGRSSKRTRSIAGSALAQARAKKRGK